MLEERITILQAVKGGERSVSDLVRNLNLRHGSVVALLRAMETEGMIYFLESNDQSDRPRMRGRPKKIPKITELGVKMLEDFQKCQRDLIQINDSDIRSSRRQISSRKLLEERNIPPYQRFFELSEIAFNIRNSVTRQ